jgi:hypothetical protein
MFAEHTTEMQKNFINLRKCKPPYNHLVVCYCGGFLYKNTTDEQSTRMDKTP